MIFVGIDPGKHGAIAWIDGERKRINVQDCPLIAGEYAPKTMATLLVSASPTLKAASEPGMGLIVTMEAVHAMPTDGRCSAFTFGVGYGIWIGIMGALGITPHLVSPQTWKRTMLAGIANDKAAESNALKQRFQGHPIASQLHGPRGGIRDGRVDALFLAEYGRMQWKLTGRRVA